MSQLLDETDFVLWAEQQAERLVRQDLYRLGLGKVAEAILALGRSKSVNWNIV